MFAFQAENHVSLDVSAPQHANTTKKEDRGVEYSVVKSGQTIVERICELTGIPYRTVMNHLVPECKQVHENSAKVADFRATLKGAW